MSSPLVECIPNFSEGRRPEIIEKITLSITSVQGAQILDCHSDEDHNRTVVTVLGEPSVVEEAMFRAISTAAKLIDMDSQQGAHPRIGATDVVPFVPIRDISMQECVLLAKKLGERVAQSLEIPVYFYEEAASKPERANLEYHRRGQYEGLKEAISSHPDHKPDLGPLKLGKAGAVVIGAREALIAFNVYLDCADVNIAKKIAKSVRFSSGGLRFVKAMGVMVEGCAQVSMNLTNFRKTSIACVIEMNRSEARRYGTSVHHCELVGLIPQEALVDAAVWFTQLDQFSHEQILENKLYQLQQSAQPDKYAFLDELASPAPTPGGGSAAAFTAAQASALVAMVAGLTIGKKKYADVEGDMQAILNQVEQIREKLTLAVEQDANAFNSLMTAYRLPKETEEEVSQRVESIRKATIEAAKIPLNTVEAAKEVLVLATDVARKGNLNAITDAGTGAALAFAAITGAGANVRINLIELADDAQAVKMLNKLEKLEKEAVNAYNAVRIDIKARSGITLL